MQGRPKSSSTYANRFDGKINTRQKVLGCEKQIRKSTNLDQGSN